MQIQPLQDRIVVRRAPDEAKTKAGIFIPDTAKELSLEAEVIAVGPGKTLKSGKLRPLGVKTGDRVLIGKYAGTKVKVNGNNFLIVKEEDILGTISEK